MFWHKTCIPDLRPWCHHGHFCHVAEISSYSWPTSSMALSYALLSRILLMVWAHRKQFLILQGHHPGYKPIEGAVIQGDKACLTKVMHMYENIWLQSSYVQKQHRLSKADLQAISLGGGKSCLLLLLFVQVGGINRKRDEGSRWSFFWIFFMLGDFLIIIWDVS